MLTDELDRLLDESDPASDLTARERRPMRSMVRQSAPRWGRRLSRPIAIGAIATALLGGSLAAATAAATGLWHGWAEEDALVELHYELPSGKLCEMRIGNVQGAPAEVDDAIRDAFDGADLGDADVVEGAARAGESGDPLTDDQAYQSGYNWAVVSLMEDALEARGLDRSWASVEAQGACP